MDLCTRTQVESGAGQQRCGHTSISLRRHLRRSDTAPGTGADEGGHVAERDGERAR
jgi:hypothetical protein